MTRPTCIDLFCGCGGLSLGFQRAGFKVMAAIDSDAKAIKVFGENLPEASHVLERDLTKFTPQEAANIIGVREVDVITGGPPCQGFSTARRRDGSNNGPRMVADTRRHLYQEFLRYVEAFQPKVFVMENVLGIKSAAGGQYFTTVQTEARRLGYRVHPQIEKAWELGVPQRRIRQLIIGTRLDLGNYFPSGLERAPRAVDNPTLGEAIGDLPPLKANEGADESIYDMQRRRRHVTRYRRGYLYRTLEVQRATRLTAHRARPQSDRDLRDFARLKEGESSARAMRRGEAFEFPYNKKYFKDRYTRQHRGRPCSTIVAHMKKDGLMFIHPTQNRSLTAREAARVQSFPDWFTFSVSRTHQYRLIGNAVPPLVAEALGIAVKEYLARAAETAVVRPLHRQVPPASHEEALAHLAPLVATELHRLRRVPATEFRRGWFAIAFLFPGLHPDGALDHGTRTSRQATNEPGFPQIDAHLMAPYYVQSGWPVALELIARDARRRYEAGELTTEEFYCSDAAIAGLRWHQPSSVRGGIGSDSAHSHSSL